jgi:hypothetical protein
VQWDRVRGMWISARLLTRVLDEMRLGARIQVRSLDRQRMITVYHIRDLDVNGNSEFSREQVF